MNYSEATEYIEEIPKFTKKNKVGHTRECLRRLGDPQEQLKIIHVAGTNGKGSVCAFLDSVLRKAGYSCGLFTSPHLVRLNERFQINGEPVSDEVFLEAFSEVKTLAEQLVEEGSYHPTYFETLFLMGMLIFARENVEYLVMETGLGGRLDATNSVEHPLLCVITSIGLDHTQYLGTTVEEIAGEKAGIIKPGVPVVFDGNRKEAALVIQNQAGKMGSPYYRVNREDCGILKTTAGGIDFSFGSSYYGDTVFSIPFIARYQVMNSVLALKALEVLRETVPVERDVIREGISAARWPGRMETVLPGVIIDGAHNEDGIEKFIETAVHFQKEYPITLLFSAVADKEYAGMIGDICRELDLKAVVVTQVGAERYVPARELADLFRSQDCGVVCEEPEPAKAFARARRLKGEDGLLFCVGSLYLVGEIKEAIDRDSTRRMYR